MNRRASLLLLLVCLFSACGCRSQELSPVGLVNSSAPAHSASAIGATPPDFLVDVSRAIRRARAALREGLIAEWRGSDESVDRYYEAVAFAYSAMTSPAVGPEDLACATSLYNEAIGDCLRAAGNFGRIDPRSHLTVNTPEGSTAIPVAHRGFVWSTSDFERLLDPCAAPRNPSEHHCRIREGLGAPQVVERRNPRASDTDRFLMEASFFTATAILRPGLGPWLGRTDPADRPDTLELLDSVRIREVEIGGARHPLAANFVAPVAYAQDAVGSRQYTWTGFINPSAELKNAALTFAEPYQPGKIPVVFVHGLLDNPYHFTDIVTALRAKPGFIEKYQIATFRYPTGTTFLRSGAMLRRDLHAVASTFDPRGTDPGLQNTVIVGFSMGGMLTKLQIISSGDELWKMASSRPIDALVTSEESRALLRKIFFFEPVPFVKRVVFLATPHDGGSPPTRIAGRIASPLVQKPADTVELITQLQRDNPGAVQPAFAKIPTSVDLLTNQPPILQLLRRLSTNPATTYHTILGTGYFPPPLDNGDTVVKLTSARSDGAASEHHVRAVHFDICYKLEVIAEIERILDVHLVELGASPLPGTPVAVSPPLAEPGTMARR